jgi:PKD repeat protein
MTDKVGGSLPLDITFKLDTQGSFDKFEWNFGD